MCLQPVVVFSMVEEWEKETELLKQEFLETMDTVRIPAVQDERKLDERKLGAWEPEEYRYPLVAVEPGNMAPQRAQEEEKKNKVEQVGVDDDKMEVDQADDLSANVWIL